MWSVVENVQLNSEKLFNLPCGESREGINELVASVKLLSLHSLSVTVWRLLCCGIKRE